MDMTFVVAGTGTDVDPLTEILVRRVDALRRAAAKDKNIERCLMASLDVYQANGTAGTSLSSKNWCVLPLTVRQRALRLLKLCSRIYSRLCSQVEPRKGRGRVAERPQQRVVEGAGAQGSQVARRGTALLCQQ